MTQNELESFIQVLMDLKHGTPMWYWYMLDLSRGNLNMDDLKTSLKISGNKTGPDADMLRRVVYFNEHKTDTDVKTYLNIVRLFLPIIVNDLQFNSHKEFDDIEYYTHIVEFVSYIDGAKLQYDILTSVIDKLAYKLKFAAYQYNTQVNAVYTKARALRSVNDYAQNPAQHTKRDPNDKWFDNHMKTTIQQVRDTRMDDLSYYMKIIDNMHGVDKSQLKFDVATEITLVGWEQLGEIASRPRHVWNDPNDTLGEAISDIGNNVRHNVAAAGRTPEIESLLNNVVWPNFATADLRRKIITNTFYPNKIPLLIAAEQKKLQK